MRLLSLAAAIAAAGFVHGQGPKPKPDASPKITIGKRPDKAPILAHTAHVGELVRLNGDTATAKWEIVPSSDSADLHPDGKGNATMTATDAGIYFAVCYEGSGASWIMVEFTPRVVPGPGPKPPTPVDPIIDPPAPINTPIGFFVVVENTTNSASFRGDIFASSTVQTYYKANGLGHRVIDTAALEGADAIGLEYAKKAEGKELPYLFLLDKRGGRILGEKPAAKTPEGFVAQLAGGAAPPAAHARKMGNKVPPVKLKTTWKQFGAAPNVPMIPRDKWKPIDLSAFLPAVKDQDGVGACNAFAAVTIAEACRTQQGLPYRQLSCGWLYGNINGQRDDGSMLEDGMEWMSTKGTCLTSTVPDLSWRRNSWPANAAAEALNFVALEVYVCPNFDAIASALQQGFFIVEGVQWYDNFDSVDSEGWLPARGRGNWGGHALAGYGLVQRGGVWGIATRNSWSTQWGKNGNCVIPESLFSKTIGGYWAVRSMKQTDGPVSALPFAPKLGTVIPSSLAKLPSGVPAEFAIAP